MKVSLTPCVIVLVLNTLWFNSIASAAEKPKAVESVMLKENQTWESQGTSFTPALTNVLVAKTVEVKTNGLFTVNQGKERQLREGQTINADGLLISPNGSVMPVYDHLLMKAGKPWLVKDGESAPLNQAYTLGTGAQVLPDGMWVQPGGRRTRLLDGQLLLLDGSMIPVKDSALLRNGQVTVQKDGSLLPVHRNSSLMMNDGTKVFGDGRILYFDGRQAKLVEGEVLLLTGVVTRPR